jgi:dipeptidyl aminopeptidase/acylaminoacyl peptidase
MYHALRDNNVPVKFVQFVAPTHGPSNPRNTEELTAIWLEWLDRYLK